jgi:putative membrane protein
MQLTFNPPTKSASPSEQTATKPRRSDRIRDHLANERTYLAWMRSAISLMGFGIVIVRMRMFQPPMMPSTGMSWKLGLAFAVVGLLTVWLSTQHYFGVRRDIDEDTYEPADRWVILFSLAVLLLGSGIIYYVFAVPTHLMVGAMFE